MADFSAELAARHHVSVIDGAAAAAEAPLTAVPTERRRH